jgi:5'(3')-deoxyribonucleotidase
MTKIALVDLDGTLADYDGAMAFHYAKLIGPGELNYEEACNRYGRMSLPDHIWERCQLIKSRPGWWKNLPLLQAGDEIVCVLQQLGYEIHIATRGPTGHPQAWTEKFEWVKSRMPFVKAIHITEDKSVLRGDVLIDDWPSYCDSWAQRNPNGLVVMPAHDYNTHCKYFRFDPNNTEMKTQLTLLLKNHENKAKTNN